jgi:hypothetical protein
MQEDENDDLGLGIRAGITHPQVSTISRDMSQLCNETEHLTTHFFEPTWGYLFSYQSNL